MTAPTQTTANKAGMSNFSTKESTSSIILTEFVGGLSIGVGSGTPNAYVTAAKGSLFIDVDNPLLYMNTDGATAWEAVAGQS